MGKPQSIPSPFSLSCSLSLILSYTSLHSPHTHARTQILVSSFIQSGCVNISSEGERLLQVGTCYTSQEEDEDGTSHTFSMKVDYDEGLGGEFFFYRWHGNGCGADGQVMDLMLPLSADLNMPCSPLLESTSSVKSFREEELDPEVYGAIGVFFHGPGCNFTQPVEYR